MNILYFHQYFSTLSGSSGTRSYEFAKKLLSRGHKVTVVCGSTLNCDTGLRGEFCCGKRTGIVHGIKVVELNLPYSNYDGIAKRTWIFLRFAVKSIQIALTDQYDLLFATSTPLTISLPGIFAKFFRRKPFVFEVRDLWPELPKAMGIIKNPLILSMLSCLEKLSYQAASACVALSPGIEEGIRKKISPHKSIAMIPNGCDLKLFSLDGNSEDLSSFIKRGDFIALFAGAHGIANGLDALLDMAKVLLEKNHHNIKILLAGDGKLKPKLMDRARAEQLTNCIFINSIPKKEITKLFNLADVGLMVLANVPAFYYGTSPNKFFDYIACGLPVINNYPGWLADLIREFRCGITVPPENPEAFANALIRLATDKNLTEEYGANALCLAKDRFDRESLANEFVDFLEREFESAAHG